MELFPTNVPLPPNPFNQNDDPSLREAYRLCLSMESRHPNDKSLVVPARFLGYLVVELPEAGGRVVAKEVVHLCNCNSTDGDSDEDEMKLRQMFEFYVYRLVGLRELSLFPLDLDTLMRSLGCSQSSRNINALRIRALLMMNLKIALCVEMYQTKRIQLRLTTGLPDSR